MTCGRRTQGAIKHWDGVAWTATPSGVTVRLRDVWAASPITCGLSVIKDRAALGCSAWHVMRTSRRGT